MSSGFLLTITKLNLIPTNKINVDTKEGYINFASSNIFNVNEGYATISLAKQSVKLKILR